MTTRVIRTALTTVLTGLLVMPVTGLATANAATSATATAATTACVKAKKSLAAAKRVAARPINGTGATAAAARANYARIEQARARAVKTAQARVTRACAAKSTGQATKDPDRLPGVLWPSSSLAKQDFVPKVVPPYTLLAGATGEEIQLVDERLPGVNAFPGTVTLGTNCPVTVNSIPFTNAVTGTGERSWSMQLRIFNSSKKATGPVRISVELVLPDGTLVSGQGRYGDGYERTYMPFFSAVLDTVEPAAEHYYVQGSPGRFSFDGDNLLPGDSWTTVRVASVTIECL